MRRATGGLSAPHAGCRHFYPRSPCGERRKRRKALQTLWPFLSTLSLRRATLLMWYQCNTVVFLSTLSLRRATSIAMRLHFAVVFLSTLSLRRATLRGCPVSSPRRYFYPRSPCGERRILGRRLWHRQQFLSTLSLRRATITIITTCTAWKFLSTLSLRRATGYAQYYIRAREISIHALLAESDASDISILSR